MSKVTKGSCLAIALLVCVAVGAHAAINIDWSGTDGFFKSTSGTPLLNGGATALAQLIYCGVNGLIDLPDLSDAKYVGGDDEWWADALVSGNSDYGRFAGIFTQSFVSGYYYVRVFDAGSMSSVTQGMWYFNGYVAATVDNISEPPQPTEYNIDDTTTDFGETLNANSYVVTVPEPATWAFMGLGALVMFLRRRIAK